MRASGMRRCSFCAITWMPWTRLWTKKTWPPRSISRRIASRIRLSSYSRMVVRMGRRSCGGVSIVLMSRTFTSDMCSVRGIGVAVIVSTSISLRICFRSSLCATPKRCSSSTINNPRLKKTTSFCSRRCVPMTISTFPKARSSSTCFCSFSERKRLNNSTRTGKGFRRSLKVLKCCRASTVVGTRMATCRPSRTALNAARLVRRLFVGEGIFQFAQPGLIGVGWIGVARGGFAQAVEAQEIACDVLHALLDLRFCACPLCRTQAAQSRNRVTHADVAHDPVKLVGRDVELVGAGIANQEIFAFDARCTQPDEPFKASNTMFLVNNVVARIDLGQERGGRNRLAALYIAPPGPTEDLSIGENIERQALRLPPLLELALDKRQGARLGKLIDIYARAGMDGCIVQNSLVAQDFCHSSRLRCDDDDTATVVEQLATILHEGALPNVGMRCSVPPCWYASNSPSEAESIPAKRNCRRWCRRGSSWSQERWASRK